MTALQALLDLPAAFVAILALRCVQSIQLEYSARPVKIAIRVEIGR